MMEPDAHKKGLTLSVVVPEQDVTMVTDAGKLRQALVNLLGNAVKFTDHGEVCIRARYDRDAEQVEFEVEDTGIGIDAQHLPRVFDAFWQVDQAPTRRVGGTGLGLHVTRRLVRLLGGEVAARSTVGHGSCFSIRLSREWWGATEEAHEVDREPAEVGVGTG
jgi:signal transduction histidine kinase